MTTWHAQHGEDRELLARFPEPGYYVELGALDGLTCSNTAALEQCGWRGLLIEADPVQVEECRRSRPGATVVHAAAVAPGGPDTVTFKVADDDPALSSVSHSPANLDRIQTWTGDVRLTEVTVPARTLDDMLEAAGAPVPLTVVSVDVEGYELAVLRGLDLHRWRPQVVLVERENYGATEPSILWHMHRNGYRRTHLTGVNDWFEPAPLTVRQIGRDLSLYLGVLTRRVRRTR